MLETIVFGGALFLTWLYIVNFANDSMINVKEDANHEGSSINYVFFFGSVFLWSVLYYLSHKN